MIVRITYEDGSTEDHELKNGVHFADVNGAKDVPGSKLAFKLGGQQVRYLTVVPKKKDTIASIELVKGQRPLGPDRPGGDGRRLRVTRSHRSVRARARSDRPTSTEREVHR